MPKTLTLKDLETMLRRALRDGHIDSPELEACWIIQHVTGLSRSDQIMAFDHPIDPEDHATLLQLLGRRLKNEPLDHIFGYKEFYGLKFEINVDVLSPRPETEMLVDFVLDRTDPGQSFTFLDLGTGSGAIAISILVHRPEARGFAVDISDKALTTARQNAKKFDVSHRLECLKGDWTIPNNEAFEFILSNPPYIDRSALSKLGSDVKDYDPKLALYGGEDGLDAYRRILAELSPGCDCRTALAVEIGFDQGKAVSNMFRDAGLMDVEVLKDLARHDRVVHGVTMNARKRKLKI